MTTYTTARTIEKSKRTALVTALKATRETLVETNILKRNIHIADLDNLLAKNFVSTRELIKTLEEFTFILETLAHLRNLESEILPTTDKSRATLALSKNRNNAEYVQLAARILRDSGLTRSEWLNYWKKNTNSRFSGMTFHEFVVETTFEEEFCIAHDC